MTIVLYFAGLSFFARFFYAIGAWYISIVPLIFALYIIFVSSKDTKRSLLENSNVSQYSVYIAWIAMLIGFAGIGQFFSDSAVYIGLAIIFLNIILWIGSYIFSYHDGKYMAQIGYYASILYTLGHISYSANRDTLIVSMQLFRLLTLGIVGFVLGVLGTWRSIGTSVAYTVFVLSGGAVCIFLAHYIGDISITLLVYSILILLLVVAAYSVLQYKIPSVSQIKTTSIRRILAGEKIINNKHIPHSNKLKIALYHFVNDMPLWTKYTIEGANCALVVSTILLYLNNITQTTSQRHHRIYWAIVTLFVATALVLKHIGFTSVMQKVTLFAVINYALYLTLYTIFPGSIGSIVGWAIVWNIVSSILIFYAPSSFIAPAFEKQDYRYWIVMTIAGLCINMYLLGLTTLPGQLIFSIIFIYVGIQGLLLYYGIRHVQQRE